MGNEIADRVQRVKDAQSYLVMIESALIERNWPQAHSIIEKAAQRLATKEARSFSDIVGMRVAVLLEQRNIFSMEDLINTPRQKLAAASGFGCQTMIKLDKLLRLHDLEWKQI